VKSIERRTNKFTFSFYGRLFAVSLGMNWIWEMAQMFAFKLKPEDSRIEILVFCTLASVVDALVTIGIYKLLSQFFSANQTVFYLFAAALGATCAVFFERFAFRFGLWTYSELMPVVPILETGLLPFMQLTLLVPSAIWLTKRDLKKR
jgi:FlaA1/EpsC-like NDP-sugar epimerase